nr:MAG TPA: hypothetical protein [Caudoviricetes sp.]
MHDYCILCINAYNPYGSRQQALIGGIRKYVPRGSGNRVLKAEMDKNPMHNFMHMDNIWIKYGCSQK